MKYLKMVGLAAVAAAALMAVVGAGTASATQLCKSSTTPCPAGETYGSGTVLKAALVTGTEAVLTTNLDTVKCAVSTVEGKTTSAGGTGATAVTGEMTGLTFTSCKDSFGNTCEVKAVNLPYNAEVKGSNEASELVATDEVGAGASVKCGSIINCTFTTKSATLAVKGLATPPVASAEGISLSRTGGLCPSTSTWTAKYNINSPTPLKVI